MSYYNRLIKLTDKSRSVARAQARDAKRALFEVEALDADFFEHDESEAFEIAESEARYAIAH